MFSSNFDFNRINKIYIVNYQLLRSIIDMTERFESENNAQNKNLNDFIHWIRDQSSTDNTFLQEQTPTFYTDEHLPGLVSKLIVYMSRYAKLYIKKVLEGSKIQTMDEFGYLVSLLQFGPMNKTQLVLQNIQEKPTGVDIINRLIKQGLITEKPNEIDKRSKNLEVSKEGQEELDKLFPLMNKTSNLILGDLTNSEKSQLLTILQKLHNYHNPIFLNHLNNVDEVFKPL